MTSWIILLTSAKIAFFSDFYCLSTAVTNIILYAVWTWTWWGHIMLYLAEGILSCLRVFRQKHLVTWLIFKQLVEKQSKMANPPLINSLYHILIGHKYFRHIKSQNVWRKKLLRFRFYEKNSEGEINIPPPHRNWVNREKVGVIILGGGGRGYEWMLSDRAISWSKGRMTHTANT